MSPASSRPFDPSTPPHIITLVLLAGVGALNMNIFLPSLPGMVDYFETDYAVVQLAISAYLGVTAVMQLLIGPLSDRYGRRPVMLGAMLIFLLATVGCFFAPTIEVFLAFRFLQAVIASGLVLSRAVVRDMVPPEQAASMIGYVTMGMALVPMIGPSIGGVLDAYFGWQGSVAILFAFGLAVLILAWRDMGETNHNRSSSFGAQFRSYPELARSRRFWGYAVIAACASGAFFAFLGGGPFVASAILGLSPKELGLYFALIAFGYMIGNYLSGRYAARAGINAMMMTGAVISTVGMALALVLFAVGFGTALALFGSILLVGVGNGLTLPSANAGLVSVRPHLAGSASGLGGALMIGGGAGLAAFTGSLLSVETGAYPLLWVMLTASAASGVGVLYVIARERKLEREGLTA
ncbi:multidrug effflux MFS transporter [Pontivivens insulae]|uniref:Bcr/CflA family efflux transporter n=1 Tax=Pontivivens insulae TaxID=1639689 RepID=A0A2R8ADD3_9RHOB|nr:multidrug effflux MFS transporter [Pontivivens insulae]RED13994.1 DHA1 family bicyclomycin/chloramphenicol resistance-like MFS transporter [Pontivivens insulae]SPF30068.1 Inner membrane transport protein YdhC [Pontivivens insulae]